MPLFVSTAKRLKIHVPDDAKIIIEDGIKKSLGEAELKQKLMNTVMGHVDQQSATEKTRTVGSWIAVTRWNMKNAKELDDPIGPDDESSEPDDAADFDMDSVSHLGRPTNAAPVNNEGYAIPINNNSPVFFV